MGSRPFCQDPNGRPQSAAISGHCGPTAKTQGTKPKGTPTAPPKPPAPTTTTSPMSPETPNAIAFRLDDNLHNKSPLFLPRSCATRAPTPFLPRAPQCGEGVNHGHNHGVNHLVPVPHSTDNNVDSNRNRNKCKDRNGLDFNAFSDSNLVLKMTVCHLLCFRKTEKRKTPKI